MSISAVTVSVSLKCLRDQEWIPKGVVILPGAAPARAHYILVIVWGLLKSQIVSCHFYVATLDDRGQ